ncbi:hypothetical protein [Methanoregula sp.]|uniref:hypothetical protein n=1 Tax=Methanoregula sp. TaxID=2052170 RepID=UPI003C1E393D
MAHYPKTIWLLFRELVFLCRNFDSHFAMTGEIFTLSCFRVACSDRELTESYQGMEFMKMRANKKVTVTRAMNDGRLFAAHPASDDVKANDQKSGYTDSMVVPHDRVSEVDTSILQVKLTCPRCGESTLHAEFPDHYECWIKCSSCGFFMGMSNDEWHRMENSPNVNEKIKKMARKKELLNVQP